MLHSNKADGSASVSLQAGPPRSKVNYVESERTIPICICDSFMNAFESTHSLGSTASLASLSLNFTPPRKTLTPFFHWFSSENIILTLRVDLELGIEMTVIKIR